MFGLGGTYWDPAKDVPDLTGKVAIVTGGNSGIGSAITEQLAARGAKVYLGARSGQKAKEAIAKIEKAHPAVKEKGSVVWLPLDLTTPSDVVKSAKDFMAKEQQLDILVNNAARLSSDYELSDYGVELSIAINHIGHFVLVESLMPVLKATAARPGSDVRIAIMSSDAIMFSSHVASLSTVEQLNAPWKEFAASNGFVAQTKRYAFTKLLNELFKIELQRRLDSEGANILAISMTPGMVATENSVNAHPWYLKPLPLLLGRDLLGGATSGLYAATATDVKNNRQKYKAAYLRETGKIGKAPGQSKDAKLAGELWALTRHIVDKESAGKS